MISQTCKYLSNVFVLDILPGSYLYFLCGDFCEWISDIYDFLGNNMLGSY